MNRDSYKTYSNVGCNFYPCHKVEDFTSCMFCFCPLYHYDDCGGEYTHSTKGIKDCRHCVIPHKKDGWDYIMKVIKVKILNK